MVPPQRRGNFTSDTNIYMVHFLREMADAHTALGHPPAAAAMLLDTAWKISAAVNEHSLHQRWTVISIGGPNRLGFLVDLLPRIAR